MNTEGTRSVLRGGRQAHLGTMEEEVFGKERLELAFKDGQHLD